MTGRKCWRCQQTLSRRFQEKRWAPPPRCRGVARARRTPQCGGGTSPRATPPQCVVAPLRPRRGSDDPQAEARFLFVELLSSLQPERACMRLFNAIVRDAWQGQYRRTREECRIFNHRSAAGHAALMAATRTLLSQAQAAARRAKRRRKGFQAVGVPRRSVNYWRRKPMRQCSWRIVLIRPRVVPYSARSGRQSENGGYVSRPR
jgi:hypothetical protein